MRREVTYEAVEGEAELPDEITVSVLAGNDEELVRCRAVDQVEEDAYWRDDFSFPITFYEYGAGEYQLGEIMVKESELIDFSELTELAAAVWNRTALEHGTLRRRIRSGGDWLGMECPMKMRTVLCAGTRWPAEAGCCGIIR